MIEAIFTPGEKRVQTEKVWQFDRGVNLFVKGLSGLNADTEFHFEIAAGRKAMVKKGIYSSQDNSITVNVPAAFLEHTDGVPKKIWMYLSQGENRFTKAVIEVPVASRQCPDDYITQDDLSEDFVIERAVEKYLTKHPIDVSDKEDIKNKLSAISNQSQEGDSDKNYPTVGAVRDFVDFTKNDLENYVDDELNNLDTAKADKSTTLAGYGINNAYTKIETDKMLEDIDSTVQLIPDFANTISECTDTSKLYVLPDGFIYAYMYGEVQPENILETNTIYLNKRKNSSHTITNANGYITTDLIPVEDGDIIRFSSAALINSTYCRMKFFDSNGSRVTLGGDDWNLNREFKIETDSDGFPYIVVGYYNTTSGDNSSNQRDASKSERIASFYINLQISSAEISDIGNTVVTKNESISGDSEYSWKNTGHAFVPADYEKIITSIKKRVDDLELSKGTGLGCGKITAPSPQPPADGTKDSDFNADNMSSSDIYDAIDALCEKFPNYIIKENLGKDASNTYDWNRYVLSKHYYSAWQKQNFPKMYAWKNGSAVIYSESVSPRIGDVLYSTQYIGTSAGTVTSVDNANQTRTVGGAVYTRDKASDVSPSLVFTTILDDIANSKVYDETLEETTRINTISDSSFTGTDGNIYLRYPLGDRDFNFSEKKVIVIGANEHGVPGDPREPAIVTTRLITDLCRCKNISNAFISMLKNDYMLVVCPIINPWGFNRDTGGYVNSNGVNINRNYDTPGFNSQTDSEPRGSYGGSEIETQYFMNTIVESGASVAVSYHALGYSGSQSAGYVCHYQYNGIEDDLYKLESIAEQMKSNYNLEFTSYGEANPQTTAKSPSFITHAGANGGIIEMQPVERDKNGNASYHTALNMEANYTLMLDTLYLFLSKNE